MTSTSIPQNGEWKKIETLGKGSFGEVELYEESDTKTKIAVKVFKPGTHVVEERHRKYWESESNTIRKCDHPRVARAYECPPSISSCADSLLPVIAMEHLNGGNLRELMRPLENGWFPELTVRHILRDMCDALNYLHGIGIVHRDIKPENIMRHITGADRDVYKIIDLGYIKELDPDESTNSYVGTSEYLAPELLLKNKYNFLVDYWSLGVTAFELVTGHRPFSQLRKIYRNLEVLNEHDGIISAVPTPKGFEYRRELTTERNLTKNFRDDLTRWLRIILSYKPKKRNPPTGLTSLESMLLTLDRNVINILETTTHVTLTFSENATESTLHSCTTILPSNQLLISSEGKCITFKEALKKAKPYVNNMEYTAYLFDFNSPYVFSHQGLPVTLRHMLDQSQNGPQISLAKHRALWHHMNYEYSNMCDFLNSFRTLVLYLNAAHTQFNADLNGLSRVFKEVKVSAKVILQNYAYDKQQMDKFSHSALSELQGQEVVAIGLGRNVDNLKSEMARLVVKANSLHSRLIKIRESPYIRSKSLAQMESARSAALVNLRKLSVSTSAQAAQNMISECRKLNEEKPRILKGLSENLRTTLVHLKELHETARQCDSLCVEMKRQQIKLDLDLQTHRTALWNVIKTLMLVSNVDAPEAGKLDSLTDAPDLNQLIQGINNQRTQMESLNSIIETDLKTLSDAPQTSSFM